MSKRNGQSGIGRFRSLAKAKQQRRRIIVEIEGETFPFRFTMEMVGEARRKSERDPVEALGRLTRAIAGIFHGMGLSPVLQRLFGNMGIGPAKTNTDADQVAELGATAEANQVEIDDSSELVDVIPVVLGEFSGEIGEAILANLNGELLEDAYTVLLWGLRDMMPSMTQQDLYNLVDPQDVPGLIFQVFTLLFERQSPARMDEEEEKKTETPAN